MSLMFVVLVATLAVAKAGHLAPNYGYAAGPAIGYGAHVPAISYAAAPVVSSYGYATKALAAPAVHYNVAPAIHAAPAPIATGFALGGHYGTGYGTGFGFGRGYGFGGHFGVAPVSYGYGCNGYNCGRGYAGGYGGW